MFRLILPCLMCMTLCMGAAAAQASADPATTPHITGKAVSQDGKPAAGVTVSFVLVYPETHTAQILATTQTNADGDFELTPKRENAASIGSTSLLYLHSDNAAAISYSGTRHGPLVVTLRPLTAVRLTLVDKDGHPVPNVGIAANWFMDGQPAQGGSFYQWSADIEPLWTGTSGADGSVELSGLPQGYHMSLDIDDARFAHLTYHDAIDLEKQPANDGRTITLSAAAAITGKILYGATGMPAAGISVDAQAVGFGLGNGHAVTDAHGLYAIDQLTPGAYNVMPELQAIQADWTAAARTGVVVAAGETASGQDMSLIRGALITGKVTESGHGQTVAGAQIGVYGPAHPNSSAAVGDAYTDFNGVYKIRVPTGRQRVYVMSELGNGPEREITVTDGSTTTIDFSVPPQLPPSKPITGIVLGVDGKPCAGATVNAAPAQMLGLDALTATTDSAGRFTFDADPEPDMATVYAGKGSDASPSGVMAAAGDDVTLRLQPNAACSVAGVVTDTAGKPVANAEVTLYRQQMRFGAQIAATRTDASGRYQFANLYPGCRYSVGMIAAGFGQKFTNDRAAAPGQAVVMDAIALAKADSFVAGHVVDDRGEPVAGARVMSSEDPAASTTTDRSGAFRLDGLPEDYSHLMVTSADDLNTTVRIAGGKLDAVITLHSYSQTTPAVKDIGVTGKPAPELHAVTWVNAQPMTLTGLRGKIVLIDFWGIGCGPCVAILPSVEQAWEDLRGKGVVVIGLHNFGIDNAKLTKFAHDHGLTYPLAVDSAATGPLSFGEAFSAYGVVGIPSAAVIDQQGRVAMVGELNDAVAMVGRLLSQ